MITETEKERDQWAYEIITVISKLDADVGIKSPLPSAIAPRWIPDDHQPNCRSCGAQFTLFNRRHHCRACGHIVCNKCSTGRAIL